LGLRFAPEESGQGQRKVDDSRVHWIKQRIRSAAQRSSNSRGV
jgi:hypothetical protein